MSTAITWSTEHDDPLGDSERLTAALSAFVPLRVSDVGGFTNVQEFANLLPMDDIVYVDLSWGPRTIRRPSPKLLSPTEEYYALAAVHSGSETVQMGANSYRLEAGDVVLWDCQAATHLQIPLALHKSAVLVPSHVLDHMSLSASHRQPLEYFNNAPIAPLLRQLLVFFGAHTGPTAPAHRRTRNALLEMALGTIESTRDTQSTSLLPGLRMAVCQWIDDHIYDPDLDPHSIAAAHSVSVRTLHRAFQTETLTLAELLRVRRLERACDLLGDPLHSVSSVSARLHFANPSHFSRVFTRHYGLSPSEYRSHAIASMQSSVSA
jgi:AraC family transcriptional activator of tynA and feaB